MIQQTVHRILKSINLSLFEKVILVNSVMLIVEAIAGLWITSNHLEANHYIIDTAFIVVATLITLFTNAFLLRASFRPFFGLLSTIRAVTAGNTQARAHVDIHSGEVGELAHAFNDMLDKLEYARRQQAHLILQAQENERRRIALELHDEAGQNLTALLIHSELINQQIQTLPLSSQETETHQMLSESLQQLTKLTQHTLENIRQLSQQLRPSVLDDLGLLAAMRWLVEDSQKRLHFVVHLEIQNDEGLLEHLPPVYETTLFRIAQESLTNIARHAQATEVTISLRHIPHAISLEIRDNGIGYQAQQKRTGSGILGMRERATMLKGTLSISGKTNQGTIVKALLPIPKRSKEATISTTIVDKGQQSDELGSDTTAIISIHV